MRIKELVESYSEDLHSSLSNMLAQAKANGIATLQTADVARSLVGMGYSVDVNSLQDTLQGNPFVMSVSPNEIFLSVEKANVNTDDSETTVSNLAQKYVTKKLKKDY